ncbi:MAG: DUF3570 domain-containing protein [Reinekea sp.]
MQNNKTTLTALSAAAMMLNTLSGQANAADEGYSLEYLGTKYQESELPAENLEFGSVQRYDISSHQLRAVVPLAGDTSLTVSGLYETMAGASPWYVTPGSENQPLQVMSGATIDEQRAQLDVDFYQKQEKSESTTSLGYSTESDYDSVSFGISGAWFFNRQLTTLNYRLIGGQDHVHPTPDDSDPQRRTSEAKSRLGGYIGVSQVLTKNRLVGFNIGTTAFSGYLSDPYKRAYIANPGSLVRDSRPDRKQSYTASAMLREYLPEADGVLHADLNLSSNNWGVTAFSGDVAWYKNFGNIIQVAPSARIYHQTEATFYSPFYQEERQDGYYSSDYRLSKFSAASVRLQAFKEWKYFSLQASAEHYSSFGDHPGLVSFNVISFGISSDL